MRVIQLRNDGFDHHRIFALMVAPNDERVRSSYLRMLVQEGRFPDGDDVPPGNIRTAMGWDEMKAIAQKAARMGILVGDIFVIRAAMDGMRDPSNRKASQVLEKFYRGKAYGDNKPIHASTRQIEKYAMEACRDVAHLWAAYEVMRAEHGRDGVMAEIKGERGSKQFLRIAAYFQNFGVNTRPKRVNRNLTKPLINPRTVWSVPAVIKPIAISKLPPLKQEILEAISQYSHY
jgi:hypothetical protein